MLTPPASYANINYVAGEYSKTEYMQRYRSGHNEAVLKTVCPQGHVGSNPTLSATSSRQVFLACRDFLWNKKPELA